MHGMVNASESGVNCKVLIINYDLQHANLFGLKSSPFRIELLAHSPYSNIVRADPITDHPPKLSSKSAMRNKQKLTWSKHTFFSSRNLRIVATRSLPIKSPVCLPTDELNSSKYFFSSQTVSLSGGESINDMLKEVKGRRLRVDHPSQIMDILDWIRYIKLSMKELWRKRHIRTSIMSNVIVSRWMTFAFTAPAIQDFLGMSLSCILGFK